ncbi:MarR family winged helix-turn-helix transcriptional regulator [Curtobacterium sp. ISL-83]|uniref:MarR family winged helix-turn-helix transcriptional regulator n=1 Tax=Curtobacterium sp. ISL-83 TaxID=2819145 RepID=UPI001BE9A30F|nr:MarR family transcriptional regulator [Curtobacterium sp. ISL-83]MBT2501209.1 MarR family transcriptional regulator [Curtobacterium sp. ISL-83]
MVSGAQDIEDVLAASRGLLGVVARTIAPALEHVTVPQFRLIVLVAALGPTRSSDLAQRLAVSVSTLTRNVDRLVAGGWVRRRANSSSKREVLVEATEHGRALVDEVTRRRRRELETVLAGLSDDDRSKVVEGSRVLRTALDEPLLEDVSGFGG